MVWLLLCPQKFTFIHAFILISISALNSLNQNLKTLEISKKTQDILFDRSTIIEKQSVINRRFETDVSMISNRNILNG